jgi:fumarate reductase flavoprotein subunit
LTKFQICVPFSFCKSTRSGILLGRGFRNLAKEDKPTGHSAKRRVLVVGAGSAGLAAAVQAADAGGRVTLLEMAEEVGGVSALSTGLLRGSGTFLQRVLHIKDSWKEDAREMLHQARYTTDPALIARLAENSGGAVDWLRKLGVTFNRKMVDMPRVHLILPDGKGLIGVLYKEARRRGVKFLFGTRARNLLMEEGKCRGRIIGLRAIQHGKQIDLRADAVVLCTGGVWRGQLLRKYSKPLEDLIVSYGYLVGGRGDGIRMAKHLGAKVVDLDRVIPNAAKFLDNHFKPVPLGASSSLRHGGGAIFLNQALKRFTNEDLFYVDFTYTVVQELRRRGEKWGWEIWDENARELVPRVDEYVKLGYVEKGVLMISDTLAGLAEAMGVNGNKLAETIRNYNGYFDSGLKRDPDFGRPLEDLHPLACPPFYAVRVAIECLSTRGGLKIDTEARVLDRQGDPIPDLFAAGDDTGGMHGESYMTGVSLERAIVFGRIAGENAAKGYLGAAVRQCE